VTVTNHAEQMEWDDPSLYVDPLSLLDSKRHHQWAVRAMFEAGKKLKAAADAEALAAIAYRKAVNHATLHADCPQVKSGGATVAYRDAWISDWVEKNHGPLEWDYKVAKTAHETAKEYVGVIKTQAYSMGQLGGIVKQIHGAVGLDK
jgi:hypothetical protein